MPIPPHPAPHTWWKRRQAPFYSVFVFTAIRHALDANEHFVLISRELPPGDPDGPLGLYEVFPLKKWYAAFDPDATHPELELREGGAVAREAPPPVDAVRPLEDYHAEELAAFKRQPIGAYTTQELLAIAQALQYAGQIIDKPETLAAITGKPLDQMTRDDFVSAQQFLNDHRAHVRAGTPPPAPDRSAADQ